jgi:hypothetical protein
MMLGYHDMQPRQAFENFISPDEVMITPEKAIMSGQVQLEHLPQPQTTPQLSPRLDGDSLDRKYQAWEDAKRQTGEIDEQFKCSRYYHSKQWTDAELRELKRRKQPPTTKNRIKRKVDFLVGVEQRLRRDPKCYPRTPAADKAAYVSTAALRCIEDETKWTQLSSAATKDALIRGIGVVWQGIKIRRNKPEICKAHVPSDRFFYDPASEAWDFADARYLGEWQWLDMDQAIEMMPFSAQIINELARVGNSGAMSTLPQEFAKIHNRSTWMDSRKRLIRVTHIWYKYAGDWMFDYLTGPISLCPEDYDCKSPYQNEDEQTVHPYNAWSPYVDESGVRYGVVRDMISLQDGINKRSSKMLHLLNQRQTMGKTGAVPDVDKMKREAARPDGHIEVNGNIGEDFQFVDQSAQTAGQFELLQEDKAEIENLGPNPGLIGRGVENQSGRAILAQQNSGMTELSPVFEMKREWELSVYHKDWDLAQQFWTGERYIRITSDPKAVEFLNINKIVEDPETGQVTVENSMMDMDVDVLLDQGPDTVTMREELIQAIADRPDVPLEIILELSTLPDKDIILKRLAESKQPPPGVQELAERMAKLEAMNKAADVDTKVANAEKSRAEAYSKIVEVTASTGIPPQAMNGIFPIHYREPTFMERLMLAAQKEGELQDQQPPQNAMMPQAGPEGVSGDPGSPMALGGPQQAMPGEEPQLDQAGGLPMGPGVQ